MGADDTHPLAGSLCPLHSLAPRPEGGAGRVPSTQHKTPSDNWNAGGACIDWGSGLSRAEEQLVESCIKGDAAAWEQLYRTHYPLVRRVVGWNKWGFSSAEVEDGTQEVFLEVIRSLPRFRGEAGLATFISRLARNRCISNLRKRTAAKRGREELGYVFEEPQEGQPRALAIESGPGPEESHIADVESSMLTRGIERLGQECQQIIRLRYFHQQSYNEICALLELPLGTVCSRLKRCLTRLKDMLQNDDAPSRASA
jgi:RNA polymerase sigma factor (sigma-70 family)